MKEQLGPDIAGTSNNNVPIHEMPDFQAAIDDYKRVLQESKVPPTDIERVTKEIQSNPTRKKANDFMNLVNGIAREEKTKKF